MKNHGVHGVYVQAWVWVWLKTQIEYTDAQIRQRAWEQRRFDGDLEVDTNAKVIRRRRP